MNEVLGPLQKSNLKIGNRLFRLNFSWRNWKCVWNQMVSTYGVCTSTRSIVVRINFILVLFLFIGRFSSFGSVLVFQIPCPRAQVVVIGGHGRGWTWQTRVWIISRGLWFQEVTWTGFGKFASKSGRKWRLDGIILIIFIVVIVIIIVLMAKTKYGRRFATCDSWSAISKSCISWSAVIGTRITDFLSWNTTVFCWIWIGRCWGRWSWSTFWSNWGLSGFVQVLVDKAVTIITDSSIPEFIDEKLS